MNAGLTRPDEPEARGYEKVFAFVREQLLSGQLKAGDRLLPERELATRLGVSRPVIREVLRGLAAIGVIEIRHGSGSVVRRPGFAELGDLFTMMLDTLDKIVKARIGPQQKLKTMAVTDTAIEVVMLVP